MAETEFERFQRLYGKDRDKMKVLSTGVPVPGVGGLAASAVRRGIQSGVRRFSDINKADKNTKMKDRGGLERKDPMEPRVVPSGRSKDLDKVRRGNDGPTKMKDRRGLEIKPPTRKAERPPSRGMGIAKTGASAERKPERRAMSNADVQKAYQEVNRKHGTDRPVTEVRRALAPGRVKSKPEGFDKIVDAAKRGGKTQQPRKAQGKSKTRIAFEKKFAKERAEAKRRGQNPDKVVFKFRGKKYNTKLAK